MLILGVVLVVVAVAVTVAVLQTGDDPVRVHAAWFSVHTSGLALFVSGAVCLVLLLVGLWVIRIGIRRTRRHHREMKELRRKAFEATPTAGTGAGSDGPASSPSPSAPARRPPDADDYFDTTPRD